MIKQAFTYVICPSPVPEKSLSTAATAAISAVVCLLVAFIAGTVCGVLLTVCISRWNKRDVALSQHQMHKNSSKQL